jgi:hypothetical protein
MVQEFVTTYVGQMLKDMMNLVGNTTYMRLITINFVVNVDQSVQMRSIYRYAVSNQSKSLEPEQFVVSFIR